MLELKTTSQFKKDYKRIKKRGYNLELLDEIIDVLLAEKELDEKYKNHQLIGNYQGFFECHIESDWLLIYALNQKSLILTAARTGTHADLFRNK